MDRLVDIGLVSSHLTNTRHENNPHYKRVIFGFRRMEIVEKTASKILLPTGVKVSFIRLLFGYLKPFHG